MCLNSSTGRKSALGSGRVWILTWKEFVGVHELYRAWDVRIDSVHGAHLLHGFFIRYVLEWDWDAKLQHLTR